MRLDITPFDNALGQLQTALGHAQSPLAQSDATIFETFRAGSIQAFEYTYALAVKMLRRMIEIASDDREMANEYDFRDVLRLGHEYGFIRNMKIWFEFREKRNISSHAYDENKAAEVYAILPQFLAEAADLRDRIRQRLERE